MEDSSSTADAAYRTLVLLREVRALLEREHARNWLPGIVAAIRALEATSGGGPEEVRAGLAEAASIYRAMTRGPGSFDEFYVQRADPTDQARENARFGAIADELWRLLGGVR